MPVLKKDEGVAYPAQALADGIHDTIEVRLVLTIDAAGTVTNAVVDVPVGHGFDEAALEAARKLVFDPATRDGRPVAAKFRYLYRFEPPPSILSGRVVSFVGERPLGGGIASPQAPSNDTSGRLRALQFTSPRYQGGAPSMGEGV